MRFVVALLLIFLIPVGADADPREAGLALLARLGQESERKKIAGEATLSLYFGRGRIGSLELETKALGKALVLKDLFKLRIDDGPGSSDSFIECEQTIDERGYLISAKMVTKSPRADGKDVLRRYELLRKEGAFHWRKTVDREVETKVIDAPPESLCLAPPLGLYARLVSLIADETSLAFVGIDMESGAKTRLRLIPDPLGDQDFRGRKVRGRRVRCIAADSRQTLLVSEKGALLRLRRASSKIRIAGGETEDEVYRSLPDLDTSGASQDPVASVVLFLRALSREDKTVARSLLNMDALFQSKTLGEAQKGEREVFEAMLIERLSKDSWVRENHVALISGALERDQFKVTTVDARTRVEFPGGGCVVLSKTGESYQIVGFERPKAR